MVTKDTLFRPTKSETKADSTTRIARGIIDAQATARQAKTARLHAARAERDASEAARKAANPPKRKKTSTRARIT